MSNRPDRFHVSGIGAIAVALASFVGGSGEAADPPVRFEPQTIDADVAIGYGLAVGDVDGDGGPDILLADKSRIVWYRNGDWKKSVIAENLTVRDNVCIAARDLDGDNRVEIAVGANWNPGETADLEASGAVFHMVRPDDPHQPWRPVRLPHEPTVHRMRWVRDGKGEYRLVVVPLHGRGNNEGQGAGVRTLAYDIPLDDPARTTTSLIDDSLHVTHNLDVFQWDRDSDEEVAIGAREGISLLNRSATGWEKRLIGSGEHGGVSEVRFGRLHGLHFFATIEPLHGNTLAIYLPQSDGATYRRIAITEDLKEGHALACADLLGLGSDQIVVGWRRPNADGKVGIRLFQPSDDSGERWASQTVDDNAMACEDLQVADLDGDSRLDIIASGRSTHNLVIYWNRAP